MKVHVRQFVFFYTICNFEKSVSPEKHMIYLFTNKNLINMTFSLLYTWCFENIDFQLIHDAVKLNSARFIV